MSQVLESSSAPAEQTVATSRKSMYQRTRWLRDHRGEVVLLAAINLAFFVTEIRFARLRPFWFDELSTLLVATQPTLHDMFRAMPTDGNPPLFFLLARLFLHLPVRPELALRLPSMIAFSGSALATYVFVRRVAARPFALMAMCLLLGSGIGERYATEGRAYSVLLCITACQLCCWQVVNDGRHRRWALAGIAACTSGAILAHQYGILYALLPLGAGEAVRWWERRGLDFGVLLAAGLGSLTILFTYPPMLRGQHELIAAMRASSNFYAHPEAMDLVQYLKMWPAIIPLLATVVFVAWILGRLLSGENGTTPPPHLQAADLAVANTLVLFLPLLMLLTHFGTGFFTPRYAEASALGVALLAGMMAAYLCSNWPPVHHLVSFVSLYCVVLGILHFSIGARPNPPVDYGLPLLRKVGGTQPIVIADSLEFMPTWWYADASIRPRLHYLSDLPYVLQRRTFLPEYSLYLERNYTPIQVNRYAEFIAAHREFFIYSAGDPPDEWLQPRLLSAGWRLQRVASAPSGKLYRATAPEILSSLQQHPTLEATQ